MKTLTRAEEEIMQVLWELEEAFVKEIVEALPDPKPAYNTVSTIVRILEQKSFVDHRAFGRAHQYFPRVSKEEYSRHMADSLLSGYFSDSVEQLLSFFVREKEIDLKSLDRLLEKLKDRKK